MSNKTELQAYKRMIKATGEYIEKLQNHIKTLEEASIFFLTAMDNDDLSKKYESKLKDSISDLKTALKHALNLQLNLANQYKALIKIAEDE